MGSLAKHVVLAWLMLAGCSGLGQVFRIEAGGSTLLDAEGGSIAVTDRNFETTIGLGVQNGNFRLGTESRYIYRGYTLFAGDEPVPFNLATDVFNPNHYFYARGGGVSHSDDRQSFYVMGGMTSTWFGTGFFNSATANEPFGLAFFELKLSNKLRFESRTIVSKRQTSLQSLEWKASKHLKGALTAGVGSNQPYFASSVQANNGPLAFTGSYIATGASFRRIDIESPYSSEVTNGNLELLYKPIKALSFSVAHQNVLQPLALGGGAERASVNEAATSLLLKGTHFGVGLYESELADRTTQGANLYLGRRLGQRWEVNANYFDSKTRGSQRLNIVSAILQQALSHRFSLLEVVSRSGGQTTVAFGGNLNTNRLKLGIDYQNVYLPFRPERPFEQAFAINSDLRIAGSLHISAVSNVAPDGHIRYTFGISTYLYRFQGAASGAPPAAIRRMPKFRVQGFVKDERGQPIEGATLHIGREVVYTDTNGYLMARFSKPGPFILVVVPDEFVAPGKYEVVSAPTQVRAEAERAAPSLFVTVRRVTPVAGAPKTQQPTAHSDANPAPGPTRDLEQGTALVP